MRQVRLQRWAMTAVSRLGVRPWDMSKPRDWAHDLEPTNPFLMSIAGRGLVQLRQRLNS